MMQLRQNLFDDFAVNVSQTERAAVVHERQPFVVDAQQM